MPWSIHKASVDRMRYCGFPLTIHTSKSFKTYKYHSAGTSSCRKLHSKRQNVDVDLGQKDTGT